MADGYMAGHKRRIELVMIQTGLYMEKTAAGWFRKMYEAARADGILLYPNSAFRTMGGQKLLYERYKKEKKLWEAGKLKKKPAIAAKPGYSNHQSGIAIDINRVTGDDPATPEPDSPIDKWLKEHASRFGFKRTVPSEPWHWEFDEKLLNGSLQRNS